MSKDRGRFPLGALRLLCTLRSSAPVLREHVSLILELACIEWQQERRRLLGMVLAGAFALCCAMSFIALSTAIILAALWDTPYCALAVSAILIAYAAGSIAAWFKFHQLLQNGTKSFGATRDELVRDLSRLKHKML